MVRYRRAAAPNLAKYQETHIQVGSLPELANTLLETSNIPFRPVRHVTLLPAKNT